MFNAKTSMKIKLAVCFWLLLFTAAKPLPASRDISFNAKNEDSGRPETIICLQDGEIHLNLLDIEKWQNRLYLYHLLMTNPHATIKHGADPGSLIISAYTNGFTAEAVIKNIEPLIQQALSRKTFDKQELTHWAIHYDRKMGGSIIGFLMGSREPGNDLCAGSDPFCTGDIHTFPAGVNSGTAEPGPNYGCLYSQPNPAWYHMRILISGDIEITMSSSPAYDIDFIAWGPFDDPVDPCPDQLTADKIVDCSYAIYSTEICYIPNGQVGEYYILMITNFSNNPCEITFQKTAGSGETDCSILPPPIGSNSPVCVGEQIQLYADPVANATYNWTGPDGFTSNQQNPVINNAQLENAGTYTLIITVGGNQSEPVSTEVAVFPMPEPAFSYGDACLGEPTQFTDLSTVDPPTAVITAWQWDFGDGNSSTQQHPEHTYASAGTFQVSLSVFTGDQQCEQSLTQPVTIGTAGTADAGPDQTIYHGWYAQLSGNASGGSGDYSYNWQPESLVQHPDEQTTATVPLTSTATFTLVVTDNQSNCSTSDEITVFVEGDPFVVNATAEPGLICPGESSQLIALATGGSGSYSYAWTSDPPGFESDLSNPTVSPDQTTIYTVEVFDGQLTLSAETTVSVGELTLANAGPDLSIPTGWTAELLGSSSGGSGSFVVDWQPEDKLEDHTQLQAITLPLTTTTAFTLTITDNSSACASSDQMVVTVTGGPLEVNAYADPSDPCAGQTVQLQAIASGGSGEYTYNWTSDPPGFNSDQTAPVVTPLEPTTYFIVVDDGQNIASDQVFVNVGTVSQANAGPDQSIPAGTSAQLEGSVSGGSGSFTVQWEPASLLIDPQELQAITVNLDETTVFTLEITDEGSGCVSTDQMTVVVSGSVLAVDPQAFPDFICPGETVELSANATGGTGSYSYQWSSDPPGFSSGLPNPLAEPIENTTYFVEVSDGNSAVTGQVGVSVGALSVAHAGDDFEVNYEWPAELQGSVSGDITHFTVWWEPAALFEENANTQLSTSTLPLTEPAMFSLSLTNTLSGCISTDDVQVNVSGGPLGITATASPGSICTDEQVQLLANPYGGDPENYSFSWWSVPAGFSSDLQNPIVVPQQSTTYHIQLSDGYNTVETSVFVEVISRPAVHAGENIVINVGTQTQLNGAASGGSGNYSWNWSPADSLDNPVSGPSMQNPFTKLLFGNNTFSLTVIDANGCSSYPDQVTVFTGGDQLAVFAQAEPSTLCFGESTVLTAAVMGGNPDGYTFHWTAENTSWESHQTQVTVSPETDTRYHIHVFDGYLDVYDFADVTVNPLPDFDIIPDGLQTSNDTLVVCVHDSIWLDAGPGFKYLWSNGSANQKQRVTTNGNWLDWQRWQVIVTDTLTNCSRTQEVVVFFNFNACNIGLDENTQKENQIKVHPNPSDGVFTVTIENPGSKLYVQLYNLFGQKIQSGIMIPPGFTQHTFDVDLSGCPDGPYLLQLIDQERVHSLRLIKR